MEKTCKKITKDFDCEVVYDESTRDEVGLPHIDRIVEYKIGDCDVFVADVTPVTNNQGKLVPNSNVMYELGRTYGKHNFQRIIVLAAEGDWNVKNMPFDINHSTIIPVDVNSSDYFYHLIKGSVKYSIDSLDTIFYYNDSVLYSDL